MAVTIKQVALLAKTSRATVDRVLHNRGNVDDKVKTRVLKAIKTLGYTPNAHAALLAKTNKVYNIGIIINSTEHQFYTRVKKGINMYIDQHQQHFVYHILENRFNNIDQQLANIKQVANLKLDALIITPINDQLISDALDELDVPTLFLTNDMATKNRLGYLGCHYHSNGIIAADLVNQTINGNKLLVVSGPQFMSGYRLRLQGFLSNLNDDISHDLIVTDNSDDYIVKAISGYQASNKIDFIYFMANGLKGLLSVIKNSPKIITVDESKEVIKALQNEQVAITITQQPEKQGYKAIQKVCDYLMLKIPINSINYIGNKIKVKHSNFNELIEGENENE